MQDLACIMLDSKCLGTENCWILGWSSEIFFNIKSFIPDPISPIPHPSCSYCSPKSDINSFFISSTICLLSGFETFGISILDLTYYVYMTPLLLLSLMLKISCTIYRKNIMPSRIRSFINLFWFPFFLFEVPLFSSISFLSSSFCFFSLSASSANRLLVFYKLET